MDETFLQVLHVGCGADAPGKLHNVFGQDKWREVRLDIDASVAPDFIASITDMACIADGQFDGVYSSHNLEHLYPHEVSLALREFRRVLKPTGFTLVTMPDLQAVGALLANGELGAPAYVSSMGPVAPLDMLYGFRPALAQGNLFMAHRTGFTGRVLLDAFREAGFSMSVAQRNPLNYSLWGLAFVNVPTGDRLADIQERALPFSVEPAV